MVASFQQHHTYLAIGKIAFLVAPKILGFLEVKGQWEISYIVAFAASFLDIGLYRGSVIPFGWTIWLPRHLHCIRCSLSWVEYNQQLTRLQTLGTSTGGQS